MQRTVVSFEDLHMPTVRVRPRHPPCPWLTENENVRDLMRERDVARETQRADPTPEATELYGTRRNAVKGALSRAKSDFSCLRIVIRAKHHGKTLDAIL